MNTRVGGDITFSSNYDLFRKVSRRSLWKRLLITMFTVYGSYVEGKWRRVFDGKGKRPLLC
jgi:hypothetical protein